MDSTRQEILKRIQLTRILKDNIRIPFKSGRPKREKRINNDDLVNLAILLNTCKSFEDFLYNC